jgi:hypothetical protein
MQMRLSLVILITSINNLDWTRRAGAPRVALGKSGQTRREGALTWRCVWLTRQAGESGGPSLRLKNGYAQDDTAVWKARLHHHGDLCVVQSNLTMTLNRLLANRM